MTTIFWGPTNPTGAQTGAAVDGDIFVSINLLTQRRKVGAGWVQIVPPDTGQPRTTTSDTRADVVPSGGVVNDRLALVTPGRPWELGWRNAALGVVGPEPDGLYEQTTAQQDWDVSHNLSSMFVDVTVVADDNETILVPRVEFVNPMLCRLHFAEAVAGTAIVRR